jgi:hypothetical protein
MLECGGDTTVPVEEHRLRVVVDHRGVHLTERVVVGVGDVGVDFCLLVVEKQILRAGGETRCVRQCTQYPRMWKSVNTSMCVRTTLEQGRGAEGK